MIALDKLEPTCKCPAIGCGFNADPTVRLCEEHHKYYRGDQELVSVTHVIKSVWPFESGFSLAAPSVLANARRRGVQVDELFSKYAVGDLRAIPIGTRTDSLRLFLRLKRWWSEHKHGEVRTQVLVADHSIAGTLDVCDDDTIYDLKTQYSIEPYSVLQIAGYADLFYQTFGRPIKKLGIIHLTQRFPAPVLMSFDPAEVIQDWMLIRDTYLMAQRRTKK